MLKKFQLWSPAFVLFSIALDMVAHWDNTDYRFMAITAALGWFLHWDAINDLHKLEKELGRE